ncbi:hypothetical protein LTR50_003152 [Elasticomyces elasticus]|nr:hypothetical protein LTR50_003152 [Elasticomyces elasticus]
MDLHAALQIEPPTTIVSPPAIKAKSELGNAPCTALELQDFAHISRQNEFGQPFRSSIMPDGSLTPFEAHTPDIIGAQTPKTSNELEENSLPRSRVNEVTGMVPSFLHPRMNRWRVLSACLVYFGNGMNDSGTNLRRVTQHAAADVGSTATGALLPSMEVDYHVGYAVVSLIFVANAIGFIATAFFSDALVERLGRARTLMISEAICIAGYTILGCTPPFPVIAIAFFLLGVGISINLAINNVFCSNLANSTVVLGAAHGSYGLGGIMGPIVATALASKGILWSRFYLITLGLRVACLLFVGWSFWTYETEAPVQFRDSPERRHSQQQTEELGVPTKTQLLKKALKSRVTIIGALFIFAYQGAEVSVSGWMISYLINYRNGDPNRVGYVTAGFWAGITLGRFGLSHAVHHAGEKKSVYGLGAAAVAFQLLAWLVPNVIGDAVAVAILGLVLGPIYPCAQTIFTRLLPAQIQMSSISFISSAGSSGGAVAPFTTGLLAQAVGTYVLHPVCIGLFAVMVGCWWGLPKMVKRTE